MSSLKDINQQEETELQAAAFRALRDHLQSRTDVQNIDMMNLAGFCRNCLSRWVQEADLQPIPKFKSARATAAKSGFGGLIRTYQQEILQSTVTWPY